MRSKVPSHSDNVERRLAGTSSAAFPDRRKDCSGAGCSRQLGHHSAGLLEILRGIDTFVVDVRVTDGNAAHGKAIDGVIDLFASLFLVLQRHGQGSSDLGERHTSLSGQDSQPSKSLRRVTFRGTNALTGNLDRNFSRHCLIGGLSTAYLDAGDQVRWMNPEGLGHP